MAVTSTGPTLLLETDRISAASLEGLFLGHFFGRIDAPTFERFAAAQRTYASRQPGTYAVMTIIDVVRCRVIDDDAKALSDTHLSAMAPRVAAVAQAIVGGGFGAAAARAIVTGQHFLKRPPYPWKIFGDVGQSSAWIAPYVALTPAEVSGAAFTLLARAVT